jgi:hypothetical protein
MTRKRSRATAGRTYRSGFRSIHAVSGERVANGCRIPAPPALGGRHTGGVEPVRDSRPFDRSSTIHSRPVCVRVSPAAAVSTLSRVGLLTVDVNPFGVVMTSDSQPVDIFARHVSVHMQGAKVGSHIVRARARGFNGLAGYVGTEIIERRPARQWLQDAVVARSALTLSELCEELAAALTEIWTGEGMATHLSIFVAGYEGEEPCFWFISNGEVDASTTSIPVVFEAVDDLGGRYHEVNARPGETRRELVARTQPSFRRGVLAAARIFDGFTALVVQTIQDGHPQIPPVQSLDRYAAYAKFRFEFAKRMYDPKYGVGTDPHPPVAGTIHVYSVDSSGTTRVHGKHVNDARIVA